MTAMYTIQKKPNKKSRTCRDSDKEMVIDSLNFISKLKKHDYSIIKYVIKNVKNKNIKNAYCKIIGIRYVGIKTGPLFLRDTVVFYDLESYLREKDHKYVQPVDTWVRQICEKFGWIKEKEKIKNIIIQITKKCTKAGVSPLKFNQGLWYLGSHSLDLLLKGFSLEN